MPLHADLYLNRIDLAAHAGADVCQVCRVDSLEELLGRLRSGQICSGACPHWPQERIDAFRLAMDADQILPTIPSLDVPTPTGAGLIALNEPVTSSPILITGNSRLTQEVLLAVLSTTTTSMWMACVDTGGHTVDMALVFRTLTPEAIVSAMQDDAFGAQNLEGRIILPGLAEQFAASISSVLCRHVEVGPICAAELPFFFGEMWHR